MTIPSELLLPGHSSSPSPGSGPSAGTCPAWDTRIWTPSPTRLQCSVEFRVTESVQALWDLSRSMTDVGRNDGNMTITCRDYARGKCLVTRDSGSSFLFTCLLFHRQIRTTITSRPCLSTYKYGTRASSPRRGYWPNEWALMI